MLLDLGSPVGGRPSAARHSTLVGARLDVHLCIRLIALLFHGYCMKQDQVNSADSAIIFLINQ